MVGTSLPLLGVGCRTPLTYPPSATNMRPMKTMGRGNLAFGTYPVI
ncbi:hypothetical protein [uncultured Porphyromonas sp.]